jgi:hypothetical protein
MIKMPRSSTGLGVLAYSKIKMQRPSTALVALISNPSPIQILSTQDGTAQNLVEMSFKLLSGL